MKRNSRSITLDLSPTEAAILIGILEGVKKTRGDAFGVPFLDLLDSTMGHLRLQLRQLSWPTTTPPPYSHPL